MSLFTMFRGLVNNHRLDDKLMRHLMGTQTQDHHVEVSVELLVCLYHIWIVFIGERAASRGRPARCPPLLKARRDGLEASRDD